MSYTRHTWVDNETITAAKLNNIEDGIAAACGGLPVVKITTVNSPSYGRNIIYWYYATKSGNTYTLAPWWSAWMSYVQAYDNTYISTAPISVPASDDVCVLILFASNAGTITAKSGGISANPIVIDTSYYYEITGDFAVTLDGE